MQGELVLVARARRADPETSHEAAASLTSDKLRRSQEAVLALLRERGPMDDQHLVREYAWNFDASAPEQSESGLRTRRKELVQRGLVRATGTVRLPSGRNAIVWGAV